MSRRLDKCSRSARRHKSDSRESILSSLPARISARRFGSVILSSRAVTYGRSPLASRVVSNLHFRQFPHRYFRYYPRIVANWHVNYHASSRKLASLSSPFHYADTPSLAAAAPPTLLPLFAADLGLNFEQITRSYFTPGNPEFHARDERSFVIFSVHVHSPRAYVPRRLSYAASIELHFGAKRHLPLNPVTMRKYDLRGGPWCALYLRVLLCLKIRRNGARRAAKATLSERANFLCLQDDTRIMKVGDKKRWIHDPNSE